jgi:hypothetical protein
VENQRNELVKINNNIRQFEMYEEELKAKIAFTKRVAFKAEDDMGDVELEKKRQDFFIDRLSDQSRRLQEQLALYEYQIVNQQKESKAAHMTLQDAAAEMEAITFEKKQLLNQWRSSLAALQRRDDMQRSLEKAITYVLAFQ